MTDRVTLRTETDDLATLLYPGRQALYLEDLRVEDQRTQGSRVELTVTGKVAHKRPAGFVGASFSRECTAEEKEMLWEGEHVRVRMGYGYPEFSLEVMYKGDSLVPNLPGWEIVTVSEPGPIRNGRRTCFVTYRQMIDIQEADAFGRSMSGKENAKPVQPETDEPTQFTGGLTDDVCPGTITVIVPDGISIPDMPGWKLTAAGCNEIGGVICEFQKVEAQKPSEPIPRDPFTWEVSKTGCESNVLHLPTMQEAPKLSGWKLISESPTYAHKGVIVRDLYYRKAILS